MIMKMTKTILCLTVVVVAAAVCHVFWNRSEDPLGLVKPQKLLDSVRENPVNEVSDGLLQATSKDSVDPRQRDADLADLVGNMKLADGEALLDFALGAPPAGTSLGQWHGIVNECFNILRRPDCGAASFSDRLISVVGDESADPVIRDYSIQHLRAYYSDNDPLASRENDPVVRKRIENTILGAARRTGESWSGTALLALDHMLLECAEEPIPPSFSGVDVDGMVISLATNSEANMLARISAIQLCAERDLPAVLPALRALVTDAGVDASLRLSAVAALGVLGEKSDLDLLEPLVTGTDSQLVYAAVPAATRIRQQAEQLSR
jgi:hypothetical protein